MANGEEKGNDFYAVMGLDKECTESELRNAYKKLAMKWHPDRCSASGNSKFVEEAKKKFQAIQQAYSVLSDANKRFLYDIGVYDSDDDDIGMGDFLNEMAAMMSQTKPNENGEESFEELQQLFEDMFQSDIGCSGSDSHTAASCSASSTYVTYSETSTSNKRNSSEMNVGKNADSLDFEATFQDFCLGVDRLQDIKKGGGEGGVRGTGSSKRRHGRKQKVASGHDVSSNEISGISA
ncbi:dnaJ homolog subfamily B member 6 isoform X1 [Neltuma alba]|uniref:dnaJ homolog subfamily B member 6 isoform X1 n=1 Tax=Neltuma alba TaxID=207710 RepID=UPI0010A381A9|nr:dnaJ homolog subfamily B member 6 isoform X1 [Prosopis alba]